ncbi:MAG: M14 family zinc carboxypeptidase [Acidobacteriota bacterium]
MRRAFPCRFLSLTALAAAALLALPGSAWASTDPVELPASWAQVSADGPWVVFVPAGTPEEVGWVSEHIDVWGLNPDERELIALIDRDGLEFLGRQGIPVTLDETRTRELELAGRPLAKQGGGIPGFPCYRTVEETFQSAQAIATNNPGLATWTDVGDTWEKDAGVSAGYDIFVLKLTQSAVPGPKPVFFASTAIHAREYATAELGTRFAEFLVAGYGTDPNITWLLDEHEVHLMLQANPDGRKEAEDGLFWRKNKNNDYCSNTDSRGADLNRNFEYEWNCCNGSSGQQCSDVFRGPSAASEPEIQALQAYVRTIFPDQRGPDPNDPAPDDATGVAIDIHSFSELVLWPWGFTSSSPANGTAFTTLGRKVAFFNDYFPLEISDFTIADGSSADFFYGDLGVAGLAFEIGTSFFQSCTSFEADVLQQNIDALLFAAKVARTPYLTPAGPEAMDTAVLPSTAPEGALVNVSATLDDTRFSNRNGTEPSQNIASAEAFIGSPWAPGAVGIPMAAADGTFDSAVERVEATLSTTGLSPGRHLVFVQGTDTAGSTGVVAAAFLEIAQFPLIFEDGFESGDTSAWTSSLGF